jgi:ribosomal protein L12E/L44/L45/RPP1/RPP2
MPDSVKAFLLMATEAVIRGAMALLEGKSVDEALARTQEELASARAKAKFPGLNDGM